MDSNGSILSQESIHELDNYTRLLLLIPLLMINIERNILKY